MRDASRFYERPAEPPPAWLLVLMGVLITPLTLAVLWAVMWAWIVLAFCLEGLS